MRFGPCHFCVNALSIGVDGSAFASGRQQGYDLANIHPTGRSRMLRRSVSVLVLLVATAAFVQADSYKVDPMHSSVIFKIFHNNVANFYGRFNKTQGTVTVENGEITQITATADLTSIDTNNKQRDDHLKSPEFFDANQFPEISFKSTAVKKTAEGKYEVVGDLTLHGTTKSITVNVDRTGMGQTPQKKEALGLETTFTVKRSDWGVNGFIGKGIGDEVTLMISLGCNKQ
jgi:polyisoprenoid-binding protein YceI